MATRSRDGIADVWGDRTPFDGHGQWPARVDQYTTDDPERWVQSRCVLCTNGCALDIGVKGNRIVDVRGRAADRVNRGRLGPKGAGLGTNNTDGNTRLCTATAAMALRETFGNDGQPGTLADFDYADGILHVGHNVAATQTVAWMRILDRRRGANPPKLVVVEPRRTPTAAEADVHLAPRVGTNVALLNGLLRLVIEAGNIDADFIERHTVGFEKLRAKVDKYTPEAVEQITGVARAQLLEAARVLGKAERLTSTVLQGVYQSNQATAAAITST